MSENARERHNGRVGDSYLVNEEMARRSLHVSGNTDPSTHVQELLVGDVIVRSRHTGDFFCEYLVSRQGGGPMLNLKWSGYDSLFVTDEHDRIVGHLGNVVDDLNKMATEGAALESIRAALEAHDQALRDRKHGGVADGAFVDAVRIALNAPPWEENGKKTPVHSCIDPNNETACEGCIAEGRI